MLKTVVTDVVFNRSVSLQAFSPSECLDSEISFDAVVVSSIMAASPRAPSSSKAVLWASKCEPWFLKERKFGHQKRSQTRVNERMTHSGPMVVMKITNAATTPMSRPCTWPENHLNAEQCIDWWNYFGIVRHSGNFAVFDYGSFPALASGCFNLSRRRWNHLKIILF